MPPDSIEDWARLNRANAFALVGLGGAGGEAVSDIVALGIPGVHAVAVNTDARHLLKMQAEERVLIGQRQFRGRGSGGDRKTVLDAASDGSEELVRRLARFEVVFLLAGLGGGTGSALLPFLAQSLRTTDALPVPIAFLPFRVELETNPERRSNTLDTLAELEALGGLLLALSNERLRRFESLPIHRVFNVRNAYLHALVASLVDMVDQPSQLNVDLSSLKNHLRQSGLSTLLLAERHVSEAEQLVPQAIQESLLEFDIESSPSALIHLDGGSNLSLRILHRVMRTVRTHLGNPKELLFGTRIHPEPKEVVRLTAVVGGLKRGTVREAISDTGLGVDVLPAL